MTPYRVVQHAYGGPEVLRLEPMTRRRPAGHEVLLRVVATSVNPIDAKTREGNGAARALGELPISVGWDVAGVVEEVGAQVTSFRPGQRVFGMPCFPGPAGVYATHATLPAADLAPVPAGMDDLLAAALPMAGLTALSAVRDLARVEPGQRVLVRGAGGGVGHLTVQIAKALGAEVVAVVSADKADFVRGLGADVVIDRRTNGREPSAVPVDAAIDLIGGECLAASVASTRPSGVVVCVPGGTDGGLDRLAAQHGVRAERTSVRPDREGLEVLTRWWAAGDLTVHVDEVYGLADVVAAHRRLAAGGLRGKLAVRVAADDQ